MKILHLLLLLGGVAAFSVPQKSRPSLKVEQSRADFLSKIAGAAALLTTVAPPTPAVARGRATLDSSYDRYVPRIIAGSQFYTGELRSMVAKSDWQGLKQSTQDPPKKSKEDRSKIDGGISERAAQAGQMSDARVLVAADLFASAFSDNSPSTKTKKMHAQVEILKKVVSGINEAARQALGEESGGGGLFGFGAKKASQSELAKTVRDLYIEGGNAFNAYIMAANDELPVQLQKLPYLK